MGEHLPVLGQQRLQLRIHRRTVGLDVDQQRELHARCDRRQRLSQRGLGAEFGIDVTAVGLEAVAERIEVERLQGALRFYIAPVVRDEEFSVHQVHIGLDAAKALIQGIEQRAFMLVIVVRMGAGQGHRAGVEHRRRRQHSGGEQHGGERTELADRERSGTHDQAFGVRWMPISSSASPMAYTTWRMSAGKMRPMLPMRKVSAWLILPG